MGPLEQLAESAIFIGDRLMTRNEIARTASIRTLAYAKPETEIRKTQFLIECVEVIPKSHRHAIRRLSVCPYCKNQDTAKEVDQVTLRELSSILGLHRGETLLHYHCSCCSARFTNIFRVSQNRPAVMPTQWMWKNAGGLQRAQ